MKVLDQFKCVNEFAVNSFDIHKLPSNMSTHYALGSPIYEFEKGDKFTVLGFNSDKICLGFIQHNTMYCIDMNYDQLKHRFNIEKEKYENK